MDLAANEVIQQLHQSYGNQIATLTEQLAIERVVVAQLRTQLAMASKRLSDHEDEQPQDSVPKPPVA